MKGHFWVSASGWASFFHQWGYIQGWAQLGLKPTGAYAGHLHLACVLVGPGLDPNWGSSRRVSGESASSMCSWGAGTRSILRHTRAPASGLGWASVSALYRLAVCICHSSIVSATLALVMCMSFAQRRKAGKEGKDGGTGRRTDFNLQSNNSNLTGEGKHK